MTAGPPNQGYSLPAVPAIVSPAAPVVRSAAFAREFSSHELLARPRTPFDQADLPCCVSCAMGAAMETMNPGWPELSPLFHYYVTRYVRGGADDEGFLILRSGLDTLSNNGVCRRDLHDPPFRMPEASAKPSPAAFADASTRLLKRRGLQPGFLRPAGVSVSVWAKEQLNLNHPVVIGFRLPANYRTPSFLNPDFVWLDPQTPLTRSGHCVLAYGYNDALQALHIQDSQGEDEFDGGRWWMSYRVMDGPAIQEVYSLIP